MFDLPKYLPEILRESGSLFGVFALVAILIAFIVVFFFRNAEAKQKERMFLFASLFLLALVFSALIAGVSTGFETGKEVAVTQSDDNASQVELSSATLKSLESYLADQGLDNTAQNRAEVLSDALTSYTSGAITTAPSSEPEISTGDRIEVQPTSVSADSSAPDGFLFEGKGCVQQDRTIECNGLITNTKEDVRVFLFADGYKAESRIVDNEGNQYIASEIMTGSETDGNNQKVTFTQNIPVKVTLVFTDISTKAQSVALMEITGSTGQFNDSANLSFQARNIPVSN